MDNCNHSFSIRFLDYIIHSWNSHADLAICKKCGKKLDYKSKIVIRLLNGLIGGALVFVSQYAIRNGMGDTIIKWAVWDNVFSFVFSIVLLILAYYILWMFLSWVVASCALKFMRCAKE